MLGFISLKLAIGKRPHELIVFDELLKGSTEIMKAMTLILTRDYSIEVKAKTIKNVANVLTNEFTTGTGKNTYKNYVFIEGDHDNYRISDEFKTQLQDANFRKLVEELIEFGFYRNNKYYGDRYKSTALELYQKYSYEDVCKLLEWGSNVVAQNIGGYKYDDLFISQSRLIAISKSNRHPHSKDCSNGL